jgi:hypothetical protein
MNTRVDYSPLRQHLMEKTAFLGDLLGSSKYEPQILEDVPSIDDFDPMTQDYEQALDKYWKSLGYSDVRRHDYAPSGTPYTMKGPDGRYYEAAMNEDLGKWELTPMGGPQHDMAEHPDDLPDTYNRKGPSLGRDKNSMDYSLLRQHLMEKIAASPAWTRAEGKNPEGGLNAKGRASYKAQTGGTLRPPVTKDRADKSPKDAKRRASFCARSAGQMKMWPEAAKDPESRLRKARRAWDC